MLTDTEILSLRGRLMACLGNDSVQMAHVEEYVSALEAELATYEVKIPHPAADLDASHVRSKLYLRDLITAVLTCRKQPPAKKPTAPVKPAPKAAPQAETKAEPKKTAEVKVEAPKAEPVKSPEPKVETKASTKVESKSEPVKEDVKSPEKTEDKS